jgi:hypothetical protein
MVSARELQMLKQLVLQRYVQELMHHLILMSYVMIIKLDVRQQVRDV